MKRVRRVRWWKRCFDSLLFIFGCYNYVILQRVGTSTTAEREREGGREGGRDGGRGRGREGEREGGREGGRERGRERGREGERERGRERERGGGQTGVECWVASQQIPAMVYSPLQLSVRYFNLI